MARVGFADGEGRDAEPVFGGHPFFVIPREDETLIAVGAFD